MRSVVALVAVAMMAACTQAIPVGFPYGVASGDPLPTAMIIWTRYVPCIDWLRKMMLASPSTGWPAWFSPRCLRSCCLRVEPRSVAEYATLPPIDVMWKVSTDRSMRTAAKSGTFKTTAERDWTVKLDVKGLNPNTQYYYQFSVADPRGGEAVSPIGKFKTPAAAGSATTKLEYAIFSCSNWGWGYFNVYDAATRYDLDFWIHLGDYIYEYGNVYPNPDEAIRYGRPPFGIQPNHEIVTLGDYRKRYALYRSDPGLQALHAHAPVVLMW